MIHKPPCYLSWQDLTLQQHLPPLTGILPHSVLYLHSIPQRYHTPFQDSAHLFPLPISFFLLLPHLSSICLNPTQSSKFLLQHDIPQKSLFWPARLDLFSAVFPSPSTFSLVALSESILMYLCVVWLISPFHFRP